MLPAWANAKEDKGHQVDFTVNKDVESNYNTATLRQDLFNKKDSGIFIISHRGDWHGTAENSLHSIQKAIEKGCAGVEVDVRKTKDGTWKQLKKRGGVIATPSRPNLNNQ